MFIKRESIKINDGGGSLKKDDTYIPYSPTWNNCVLGIRIRKNKNTKEWEKYFFSAP
jgi:hypothetical protein